MPETRHDNDNVLSGRIINHAHELPIRVYFEDTDFSGIVYHATYIRWCERGRSDYLRLLGIHHQDLWDGKVTNIDAAAFVIRSMQIEYLKPARIDEIVTVRTWPSDATKASLNMAQEVSRGDEVLFRADVKAALIGKNGRLQRMPSILLDTVARRQAAMEP